MSNIIEFLLMIISIIICTGFWLFLSANIAFIIKRFIKYNYGRNSFMFNSIMIGIVLELCLSVFYLIILSHFDEPMKGMLVGLSRGQYISALISPAASITGSTIGLKTNKPPWKLFF